MTKIEKLEQLIFDLHHELYYRTLHIDRTIPTSSWHYESQLNYSIIETNQRTKDVWFEQTQKLIDSCKDD